MNNVIWKIISYNNDTNQYDEEILEGVCFPIKGSDKLNQEFNTSIIEIDASENGNRFPKYLKLRMYVNNVLEREYVVEQDIVTLMSFGDGTHNKLYQHQIVLIEQSKLLETKILPNVSFSYYKPFAKAISTIEEFITINDDPYGSYYLTNDLYVQESETLTTENFTPMNKFYGVLDGRGYTIHNIYLKTDVYSSGNSALIGFFEWIYNGAVVSNLKLKNFRLIYDHSSGANNFTASSLGSFCAVNSGKIINCSVEDCYIYAYEYNKRLSSSYNIQCNYGGFIGSSVHNSLTEKTAIIENCQLLNSQTLFNFSGVSDEDIVFKCRVGTFAGIISYAKYCSVRSIYITSSYPNVAHSVYFYNQGNTTTTIYRSTFAGYAEEVYDCSSYIYGTESYLINFAGTTYSNNFVGGNGEHGQGYNNYFYRYGDFGTSNTTFDAIKLSLNEARLQETYTDWDFDNIWNIDENENYGFPYLKQYIILVNDRQYSIKDMIQRLINLSDLRVYKESENITQPTKFVISQELIDKLDGNDKYLRSPEMFFHNLNLWECLWQLGSYLNAIPYLENINEINYFWLNENENIEQDNPYIAQSLTQNGTQYSTDTVSFVDNLVVSPSRDITVKVTGEFDTISKNNETIMVVYPSVHGWITPRSLGEINARITNDNSALQLPKGFEIYAPNALYIKINDVVYDITQYLYEKSAYNALLDTDTGKGLALIYDQFGTMIYGFTDQPIEGFVPQFPALKNILDKVGANSNTPFKNIQFRFIYQAKINTINRAIKENNDDFEYETTTIINQEDNLISVENLTESQQNKLNQLANIDLTKGYEIDNFSDLPQIGDYINGYYVNQVDWEIYPYVVRYNISYTKDFNRRSEFIGISRKRRPYPIPADLLVDSRRDISEYVLFDTVQPTTVSNSHLTFNGENSIIRSAFYDTGVKIHNVNMITGIYSAVNVESPQTQISDLILSTVSYPSVTGLNFHTEFTTNVSAGAKLVDLSDIGDNTASNTQVLYTKDGFCDYLSPRYIDYYPTLTKDIADELPQRNTAISLDDKIFIDFNNDRINIYKDSREIIKFIYHLLYIKKDNNIIIGNSIINRNGMIGGLNTNKYKILLSKKALNRNISNIVADGTNIIQVSENAITDSVNPFVITYNSDLRYGKYTITIPATTDTYNSYVVVDDDNNIMFGYNGTINIGTTELTPIYISFKDNDYRTSK